MSHGNAEIVRPAFSARYAAPRLALISVLGGVPGLAAGRGSLGTAAGYFAVGYGIVFVLAAVIVSVIFQRLQRVIGFVDAPSSHAELVALAQPSQIRTIVEGALEGFAASGDDRGSESYIYRGRTDGNWLSFGEHVGVEVEEMSGTGTRIVVSSKARFWWNLFDGGANADNVTTVLRRIQEGLREEAT
jgi:hypothetical protein